LGARLEELLLHLLDGLRLLALDDAAVGEHRSAAAGTGPAPCPWLRQPATGSGGRRGASAPPPPLSRRGTFGRWCTLRRQRGVSGESPRARAEGYGEKARQGEPHVGGHGGQGSWGPHRPSDAEKGDDLPGDTSPPTLFLKDA